MKRHPEDLDIQDGLSSCAETASEQKAPEQHKRCKCCGESKPLESFSTWPSARDGHRRDCKPCVETKKANKPKTRTAPAKRRPQTDEQRRRHVARTADWDDRNPEAKAARLAVGRALKRGYLAKPERCQVHGCEHRGRLEAHHFDYRFPLQVSWLCPSHHKRAHAGHRLQLVTGLPPTFIAIPFTTRLKRKLEPAHEPSRPKARTPHSLHVALPAAE